MRNRHVLSMLVVLIGFSQFASANRFGDAWEAGHSRIRKKFYPNRKDTPPFLFLTSSTSVTTSSATSFTSGGNMMKMAELREEFIDENLYALKLDSAKGQGEYIQTLAILSGCDQVGAQTQFAAKIRSNFKTVYNSSLSTEPDAIALRIDQLIQEDPEMQRVCLSQKFTS